MITYINSTIGTTLTITSSYSIMITQTEIKTVTPYKLDDSILDDLSTIQAFDGDINTLDDELIEALLVKYTKE